MNRQEALQLLNILDDGILDDDELKKAYHREAIKCHPDKFKDEDKKEEASKKFRKVTEAYNFLKENKVSDGTSFSFKFNTVGINDFVFDPLRGTFSRKGSFRPSGRNFEALEDKVIEISFEESILGTTKNKKIKIKEKCGDCFGFGVKRKNTNCAFCGGTGRIMSPGSVTKDRPCPTCNSSGKLMEPCQTCGGEGFLLKEKKVKISIRPGVQDGEKIVVQITPENNTGQVQYKNFFVKVKGSDKFARRNNDLISFVDISLLDALKGKQIEAETINGRIKLKIPPKVKNKTELKITGYGVPNLGHHYVIVNVAYPDNIDGLIEYLENQSDIENQSDLKDQESDVEDIENKNQAKEEGTK